MLSDKLRELADALDRLECLEQKIADASTAHGQQRKLVDGLRKDTEALLCRPTAGRHLALPVIFPPMPATVILDNVQSDCELIVARFEVASATTAPIPPPTPPKRRDDRANVRTGRIGYCAQMREILESEPDRAFSVKELAASIGNGYAHHQASVNLAGMASRGSVDNCGRGLYRAKQARGHDGSDNVADALCGDDEPVEPEPAAAPTSAHFAVPVERLVLVHGRHFKHQRLSPQEIADGKKLLDEHDLARSDGLRRPQMRSQCVNGPRPCPWVSCQHHLMLDVTDVGNLKINFEALEDMPETCALDVAGKGGLILEQVGEIMGITRERVRQIEEIALASMGAVEGMIAIKDFAQN